jgi:large subunit ribosomal protein L21
MPGVQPGDVLRLDRATTLGSRDYTLKGSPYVDTRIFECRAVVVGTEAEPMRVLVKKKQRERRKTHVRSKHKYTILRISELKVNVLGDVVTEGGGDQGLGSLQS